MDAKRLIARACIECPHGLAPSKMLNAKVDLIDQNTGEQAEGVIVGWTVTEEHGLMFNVRPAWDSGVIARTAHALSCEMAVPARLFSEGVR